MASFVGECFKLQALPNMFVHLGSNTPSQKMKCWETPILLAILLSCPKLHDNELQTLLLCNAYSTLPFLACKKVLLLPRLEGSSGFIYFHLEVPSFRHGYSRNVDATIASAFAECYSQIIMLMEPILLQATINYMIEECHSHFPFHCAAISKPLNFHKNFKLPLAAILPPHGLLLLYVTKPDVMQQSLRLVIGSHECLNPLCFLWFIITSSVFFGHSISHEALSMANMKDLREPYLLLPKSNMALSSSKLLLHAAES